MPVQAQIGKQAADHTGRQQGQILPPQCHRRSHKENHDRNGDRRAQAIDAIGQVHSVDRAHNDEHSKQDKQCRMDIEPEAPEGNVQVAGQNAFPVQHIQEHRRNSHLQQGFLNGRQAHVPLLLHLAVIVQEAHRTEAEGQGIDVEGRIVRHANGQIDQQTDQGTPDEHQAHHQGGSRLVVVPGGADGTHGLAGFQCPEHRQQEMPQQRRYTAAACSS